MRVATTLSVVVLAAAGIGHALVTGLDDEIARVDPFKDMKNRPEAGHGMNVLLVGTDGRDRISEEERRRYRLGGAPCHCTDTMMIVHISEDRERASIVSLPRDSYAEAPPHTDHTTGETHRSHPIKLNAAYAEGGPQLTVRTVEHMTKVKIDHYVEVDFTSFMRTVDVLGGVKICAARPLKDSYTGLDLPAGTHRLDGGQALQYVRSRHADGSSDLGRMRRQQRFMASLMSQATSSGVLLNPMKFRDVTRAVLGSVRADKEFDAGELIDLGRALRGLSPASSEFTTVPIGRMGYDVEGIGSTLKWDETRSAHLFEALRDDRPLSPYKVRGKQTVQVDVAPQQIQVQVENGTTIPGLGKKVDGQLAATGFRTTRHPVNARDRDVRRTLVLYDPGWDRSAKSLARALPGSELRPVRAQGPILRVIAGTDFERVRKVRAENPHRGASEVLRGNQVTCP
ncbi:LytR family transcriptional regulator [Streptomyces ipomoeae]|jgi:LCP family protein required for cell wall assembly|uniref:LytR family transcriptional regulator n=2 Tax=Streptomyces ipomoeae TaxID=103232 RepID=A0A540NZ66_9ACTN|nr:LCP family protein [Streptomyces ipomoeae]EKX68506.1 putative transcriptional regulator [Streptomyces ipomoeae 91-03]MDX2694989.1 LCP family protein [Streptomyces ipomoeae]MDX2823477.1 LCP family protein [Streptomyces ipomoeae]MDX2840906.1 LCP family protein [Streptomyces ipomoeae]MDX2874705.1 LCP family protein [Streptomyces ipomoeae]